MTSQSDVDRLAVLAVNAGSSSVKIAAFYGGDPPTCGFSGSVPATGHVADDVGAAVAWARNQLGGRAVAAIAHRIVLSARRPLAEPVTSALLAALRTASADDPEHLPLQIALIEAFEASWPGTSSVACFDSAFHETMPGVARLLPLPARLRAAGFERYGFHGLSCAWLMEQLGRLAGADAAAGRVILAHLGNGASITAVRNGRSIDTSMGFTPVGGLVMATRAGDLDPGMVAAICRAEHLDAPGFNRLVNQRTGLLGVSGTSGNLRELLAQSPDDPHAAEAVELFCYQARKWLGAFAAVLGGVDTLVFAGGIGEHLPEIRRRICRDLDFLGIDIDPARNGDNASIISAEGSRATVRVIATNEEAMMARIAVRALTPGEIGSSGDRVLP